MEDMVTVKRDNDNRVTYVIGDGDLGPYYDCHSVCQICGKDMPVVWDVICSICEGAYCYECALGIKGWWVCKRCNKEQRPKSIIGWIMKWMGYEH